jgi:hypothetical protein
VQFAVPARRSALIARCDPGTPHAVLRGAAERLRTGRAAGFGTTREVFVDPTDLFRLFRFER